MVKTSNYSAKLFRKFKSLSIAIEETDDEYGFNYNGAHYCIHVDEAKGTFFIYRQMVVHLVYNVHDNVVHHQNLIPRKYFFWALGKHKSVIGINGFWGTNGCFLYTDICHIDSDITVAEVVGKQLMALESVYKKMQDDITCLIME